MFVESSSIIASAANRMAYEGYSKLLPRQTGPYRAISVGSKYAKIERDGIRITVLINRLIRAAKEARLKMEISFDPRPSTDTDQVEEALTENGKTFYAVQKNVGHEY